jgi:hypothetical protein
MLFTIPFIVPLVVLASPQCDPVGGRTPECSLPQGPKTPLSCSPTLPCPEPEFCLDPSYPYGLHQNARNQGGVRGHCFGRACTINGSSQCRHGQTCVSNAGIYKAASGFCLETARCVSDNSTDVKAKDVRPQDAVACESGESCVPNLWDAPGLGNCAPGTFNWGKLTPFAKSRSSSTKLHIPP